MSAEKGNFMALAETHAENKKLRADLADARQKLAEAQADCAAKADALRAAEVEAAAMVQALLRFQEWKKQGRVLVVSKVIEDLLAAALASNAGDALVKELESLRRRVKALPADWLEDSSLETWFPLTAKELARLREELRVTHEIAERDSDEKWNLAAQRDDLRAQRDQAVLLAREACEAMDDGAMLIHEFAMMSDEHLTDEAEKRIEAFGERRAAAIAKLAALNPPTSDDTPKV